MYMNAALPQLGLAARVYMNAALAQRGRAATHFESCLEFSHSLNLIKHPAIEHHPVNCILDQVLAECLYRVQFACTLAFFNHVHAEACSCRHL